MQRNYSVLHKPVSVFVGALTFFYTSAKPCTFGDVTKIDTTGASEQTAGQDKLTEKGMSA